MTLENKKVNTRSANMVDNTMRDADDPKELLTICETVGEMVAQDENATVLVMHGSQCDGADIFAIPTDWTQRVEILKECTSESLETPEE